MWPSLRSPNPLPDTHVEVEHRAHNRSGSPLRTGAAVGPHVLAEHNA